MLTREESLVGSSPYGWHNYHDAILVWHRELFIIHYEELYSAPLWLLCSEANTVFTRHDSRHS